MRRNSGTIRKDGKGRAAGAEKRVGAVRDRCALIGEFAATVYNGEDIAARQT